MKKPPTEISRIKNMVVRNLFLVKIVMYNIFLLTDTAHYEIGPAKVTWVVNFFYTLHELINSPQSSHGVEPPMLVRAVDPAFGYTSRFA